MKSFEVFQSIQNGTMTIDQFENYVRCVESAVTAQFALQNQQLDARLKNATLMSLSYMDEFAKRGLIYHPVSSGNLSYNIPTKDPE